MDVTQTIWRWKVAFYLFLAGVGAGSYFIGIIEDFRGYDSVATIGIWLGVILVFISILFLLWDLGRPERFYKAINNPNSWITKGVFILTLFVVVGIVTIFIGNPLNFYFKIIGIILAIAIAIYTGVLIGVVAGRPIWGNSMLPILFLVSAISTGIGGIMTVYVFNIGDLSIIDRLGLLDIFLIILEGLVIYLYLVIIFWRFPESVNILIKGRLSLQFWIGLIFIGLILPLVLEYINLYTEVEIVKLLIAFTTGISLLIGGFLLRILILGAGIRRPLYVGVPFYVRPDE
jgi:formate-dependent nitrite reductase membrane component NrfD